MDSLRVFAAIIFAVSVFLLFDAWVKQSRPPVAAPAPADATVPRAPAVALPATGMGPGIAPPQEGVHASQVLNVRTELLAAEIDTRGGVLRRLELLEHRGTVDESKNFVLFEQHDGRVYVAQSGLIGPALPNHTTLYDAAQTSYSLKPGEHTLTVTLSAESTPGVQVTQRYVFHRGSYLIDVGYEVVNKTSHAILTHAYFQLMRDGTPPPGETKMMPTYTGAAVYTEESKFKKVAFSDIDKGK
ncbi:MAG: membrane protein insertase YidC, partial [Burkholderiales bacterium]